MAMVAPTIQSPSRADEKAGNELEPTDAAHPVPYPDRMLQDESCADRTKAPDEGVAIERIPPTVGAAAPGLQRDRSNRYFTVNPRGIVK